MLRIASIGSLRGRERAAKRCAPIGAGPSCLRQWGSGFRGVECAPSHLHLGILACLGVRLACLGVAFDTATPQAPCHFDLSMQDCLNGERGLGKISNIAMCCCSGGLRRRSAVSLRLLGMCWSSVSAADALMVTMQRQTRRRQKGTKDQQPPCVG